MHGFLSGTLVLCCTMVTAKHCCYGTCRSDSRYADTDRIKTCFSSDFSNRTWMEPKPTDGHMRTPYCCLYQEEHLHCCSLYFIGDSLFILNRVCCNLSSSCYTWYDCALLHLNTTKFCEHNIMVLSANKIG